MIFHTAADLDYYNYFYNYYKETIRHFYPEAELSLHFMGKEDCQDTDVRYLSNENIDRSDIKEKYKLNDNDASGYYCISRWCYLPEVNDNIVVSDVDIIAIKTIEQHKFDQLFKNYQVINITRTKKGGTLEGGMAMIAIREDVIRHVKLFANNLLKNKQLHWSLDVEVRTFLYDNFKTIEIPEMHVLGKNSDLKNLDNTVRSFAIRKGKIEAKIQTLKIATENLLQIGNNNSFLH